MFETIKARIFGKKPEVNLMTLRNTMQNLELEGISFCAK